MPFSVRTLEISWMSSEQLCWSWGAHESENPLTMGWLSTGLDCSPKALLQVSVILLLGPAG